jgi:hypothetical protein
MRSAFKSLKGIVYKRSRNNMARLLNSLQIKLKRVPENDLDTRDNLIRKIELLKIIRQEMKQLMQELA